MTDLMNELLTRRFIKQPHVYKTAPVTPGLLNTRNTRNTRNSEVIFIFDDTTDPGPRTLGKCFHFLGRPSPIYIYPDVSDHLKANPYLLVSRLIFHNIFMKTNWIPCFITKILNKFL